MEHLPARRPPRAVLVAAVVVWLALLVGPRLVYRGVREGSIDLRFGGQDDGRPSSGVE